MRGGGGGDGREYKEYKEYEEKEDMGGERERDVHCQVESRGGGLYVDFGVSSRVC